jgi:hypothetical protein
MRFALCRFHGSIVAREPDGLCFKGQCPSGAQSGGYLPREPSLTVHGISECSAQRAITRFGLPQRCCCFGTLGRSFIVALTSFIVVAQQHAGADRPNAGAFGSAQRRCAGSTAWALGTTGSYQVYQQAEMNDRVS